MKKMTDLKPGCGLIVVMLLLLTCGAHAQTGAETGPPKKFALVVGIDNYTVDPLRGCVRDAERFRDALVTYRGFPASNIAMLTDKAATYNAILKGIAEQYQKAQRGDLFVFFFSGHGTLFPDEKSADRDEKDFIEPPDLVPGRYDGAICPVDVNADVNSSGKPWENVLLDDVLAYHFSRFARKGCTVVFISDSCHSGAQARGGDEDEILPKKLELPKVIRGMRKTGGRNTSDPLLPDQIKQELQQLPSPSISREVKSYNLFGRYLLIASSRNVQQSGATTNGSLFTNALLDAMRAKPDATYNEIYKEAAARVAQFTRSKNRLQEPQMDPTYYKGSLDTPFLSLPAPPEVTGPSELKIVIKALNQQGGAVNAAKVTILPMQGTAAVAAGVTSNAGIFETDKPLAVGDYRLRVEGVGFAKFESEIELLESRTEGKASFTLRLTGATAAPAKSVQ